MQVFEELHADCKIGSHALAIANAPMPTTLYRSERNLIRTGIAASGNRRDIPSSETFSIRRAQLCITAQIDPGHLHQAGTYFVTAMPAEVLYLQA